MSLKNKGEFQVRSARSPRGDSAEQLFQADLCRHLFPLYLSTCKTAISAQYLEAGPLVQTLLLKRGDCSIPLFLFIDSSSPHEYCLLGVYS